MSRERMIGEKVLRLGGLNHDGGIMETTLVLEPRSNLKVSPMQSKDIAVHSFLDTVIIVLAITMQFVFVL